eukprot:Clim_evm5s3 gene=Clim_evmTU5s3
MVTLRARKPAAAPAQETTAKVTRTLKDKVVADKKKKAAPPKKTEEQDPAPASASFAPGSLVPSLVLKNQDDQDVDLASFKGKKVVIYFYPKADTPGCTVQGVEANNKLKALGNDEVKVFGISKDPIAALKKFHTKKSFVFDLLSDPDFKVHKAFGAYGKNRFGKMGTLRSHAVIDKDGKLEMWKRASPKDTAELI